MMAKLPKFGLVVGAVLAGQAAIMQAQSPSLNDVAKQEEARRKAIAAPAKVITNGDLRPTITTGSASSEPSGTPDAAAKPSAATPAKTDDGAEKTADVTKDKASDEKGESYWRGRITAARAALDHHKVDLDGLQSQVNALNGVVLSIDDPFRKQQASDQRYKVQHEIEVMQQQVQNDTKALADIQEEARRAGVPPGWLR
jgi:hypothetical protein